MDLQELDESSFASAVGTTCRVYAGGETPLLEIEIAEVSRAGGLRPAGRKPFSVLFLGPPGRHLPQQIYRLENPRLGHLELFLVPIGPEPSGRHRYEAVFT
jgi:hypothetical protein